MKSLPARISIVALMTLLIAPSSFATLIYSDTTVGGPIWQRPTDSGPSLSNTVRYSLAGFFTDTSGLYTIDSAQSFDGYIHLYLGNFDPLDQLTNLLAGDDDFGSNASQIASQALLADTQYFLVTSGFGSSNQGTFTNTITADQGDPNIQLGIIDATGGGTGVPAPATVALLGLGLLGLRLRRKA
ncbi:PEP-CTERM sorting domain-containing protein [Congregibacter variabilis]|uniref:PEP-CTERM sorting domain-containing protein n=1 Tax=Congregibacter variabilis TaxID=3081200 RepID=A0ABZ0HY18_9GAMM|nr:PEP-CTERM sorting domain-containing protein [Congregibacter sp. IMCC43200]